MTWLFGMLSLIDTGDGKLAYNCEAIGVKGGGKRCPICRPHMPLPVIPHPHPLPTADKICYHGHPGHLVVCLLMGVFHTKCTCKTGIFYNRFPRRPCWACLYGFVTFRKVGLAYTVWVSSVLMVRSADIFSIANAFLGIWIFALHCARDPAVKSILWGQGARWVKMRPSFTSRQSAVFTT